MDRHTEGRTQTAQSNPHRAVLVQQAVQQRGGHDDVTEDSAPVLEAAIRGEDGGALLVAGIDQLEEQVGAAGLDRQVADLIDDEQGDPVDVAQARLEGTGAFGLGERGNEFGQGREIDALMGLDGVHPQGDGQVAFADPGPAGRVCRAGRSASKAVWTT